MKTYDLSKHSDDSNEVTCPHCQSKNPKKAYVCLKCFKVMNPNKKFSLLNFYLPRSVSITVIVGALVLAAIHVTNLWLASVEANVTIHVRTAQYNLSVVADKIPLKKPTGDVNVDKVSSGLSEAGLDEP